MSHSHTFADGQVLCPYDASHVVSTQRVISHFVRCRKQHPELLSKVGICPYNQGHHIPVTEMENHLKNCPDVRVMTNFHGRTVGNAYAERSEASLTHPNFDPNDPDLEEWT